MTEKIIIDSVDVSTCKHYINSTHLDYNCNKTPASTYCKNNPDCYFKQLKRKEQECESLKLRFEKLYQFNKKLIAKNFEIGCRYIRCKNLCNEIKEISTTAYCLTNGTNKDMSDFAKRIINNINRTKEENQCEQ